MELGEKIKQARLAAGLSQRQLCGEEITRNMLSLIENGAAKPSMKTLQYLAGRLGKNVSFFLDEAAVISPNQQLMIRIRQLYDSGNVTEALEMLEAYQAPDPVFDREKELLWVLLRLELAEAAIRQERLLYAAQLLEQTPVKTAYLSEALTRRKLLLLSSLPDRKSTFRLPSIDEELLLRTDHALQSGNYSRAAHLLEAMENQTDPRWHLLRGRIYEKQNQWQQAAVHLQQAETAYPRQTYPLLETCFRELGDFQKAYEYACRQR